MKEGKGFYPVRFKDTWWLTRNILKVSLRKTSTLVTFFILPVLGMLFSMSAYGNTNAFVSHIGVVDNDQTFMSAHLWKSLAERGQIEVIPLKGKEVKPKLISGAVDCVVRIPAGFGAAIYEHPLKKVELISVKGEAATVGVKNDLLTILGNMQVIGAAASGDREKFERFFQHYRKSRQRVRVVKVRDRNVNHGMSSRSIGFLILFMMVGVGNSIEMILKEKRNRTYYRIVAAPVTVRSYIAGNALANWFVIMIQVLLALLVMAKVFGMNSNVSFGRLYCILTLFGLVAIGLGLMIVVFSKDTAQAGVMQLLVITPTCMLSGCFWPDEVMPKQIRAFSDFLPQKWAMDAIRLLQEGAGFDRIWIHLAIISAFALALFLIAAYRLRQNDEVKTFI